MKKLLALILVAAFSILPANAQYFPPGGTTIPLPVSVANGGTGGTTGVAYGNVRTVSVSDTVLNTDGLIDVSGAAGDVNLTLPSSPISGKTYWFFNSSSGRKVNLVEPNSHPIDGVIATFTIPYSDISTLGPVGLTFNGSVNQWSTAGAIHGAQAVIGGNAFYMKGTTAADNKYFKWLVNTSPSGASITTNINAPFTAGTFQYGGFLVNSAGSTGNLKFWNAAPTGNGGYDDFIDQSTSGKVLTSNGAGTSPTFQTPASTAFGASTLDVTSTPVSSTAAQGLITWNGAATRTLNLETSPARGTAHKIQITGSPSTNVLVVTATGGNTFAGGATTMQLGLQLYNTSRYVVLTYVNGHWMQSSSDDFYFSTAHGPFVVAPVETESSTQTYASDTLTSSRTFTLPDSDLDFRQPITTVAGSTSGNFFWDMPVKSTGMKKFMLRVDAVTDAGVVINFPSAFTYTPIITANNTGLTISTLTTSAITIPVSVAASGWIIVEGF
jgi:hypothetical protein